MLLVLLVRLVKWQPNINYLSTSMQQSGSTKITACTIKKQNINRLPLDVAI